MLSHACAIVRRKSTLGAILLREAPLPPPAMLDVQTFAG